MVREKIDVILNFFEPLQLNDLHGASYLKNTGSLGNSISMNLIDKPLQQGTKTELAIFSVDQSPENKENGNNSSQIIREELYRLAKVSSGLKITDFGHLHTGKSFTDTLFAIQEVCALFFHQKINVLIIGGTQKINLGIFRALKEFENNINLLNIDSRIDWWPEDDTNKNAGLLNSIAENEPGNLYNIACLAYQSYLVQPFQLRALKENHFEHYRLGELRNNFEEAEPFFRDADMVSFSISSIRMADAPAQADGSPNGLYADEACRLSRYAGFSNKVKAFGLFDIDATLDNRRQTSKLAAQIIWYYLEGYKHRKNDYPDDTKENFTKYAVHIDEIDFPIVFLKNNQTNRWWIEVNGISRDENPPESVLVSCTENDYHTACRNEIPERWWLNFKKMK